MQFRTASDDCRCELGESPVWDDRRMVVWCCDILGKAVLAVDPHARRTRRWAFHSEVCSLGLAESGRLVVALRHEVGLFDPDTGRWAHLAYIEAERGPATRLNDGKVGPDGAFWVGSMDDTREAVRQPIGRLYRLTPSGEVEVKIDGIMVSNGLGFSPDGKRMFHSDSRGMWIDRWDLAKPGILSGRIRLAEPGELAGRPDGAAVDVEGYYWSAGVSAGRLNRFAPDGGLVEAIPVPLRLPTMPCFGGRQLDELFVTSMIGQHLDCLSGMMIVANSGTPGTPVSRFADV